MGGGAVMGAVCGLSLVTRCTCCVSRVDSAKHYMPTSNAARHSVAKRPNVDNRQHP